MSNVTLTIGGKHYTVACAAGEEAHIEALGRIIDGKLHAMPNLSGQSEARTLLFAALLLADENHELHSGGGAPTEDGSESIQAAESLERLADTLEVVASRLEN
jgi:cell division protein ZapA